LSGRRTDRAAASTDASDRLGRTPNGPNSGLGRTPDGPNSGLGRTPDGPNSGLGRTPDGPNSGLGRTLEQRASDGHPTVTGRTVGDSEERGYERDRARH
jgi:hypothetical protein